MNENWITEYTLAIYAKLPTIIDNVTIETLNKDDLFVRWGFCWCDLSNYDLTQLDLEHLRTLTFNNSTKWPSKNKMPKDFEPDKIIKDGKDPMLGIKKIHQKGILGQGVTVACIDALPNINHEEIKKQTIEIINLGNIQKTHFHGECVLANLCGKTIGVAPEVTVLHYAQNINANAGTNKAQIIILKDILQRLQNKEKIKIVNISGPIFHNVDYEEKSKDKKELYSIISKIETFGCKVLDSKEFGKNFTCGHYFFDDDKTNIDNLKPASWVEPENNFHLRDKLMFVCGGKCVPQTYANEGYKFEQIDCYSWSIPQCTGLFALCLQVNPNLTFDEFVEICRNTFITNKKGYRIINPEKIIKFAKNLTIKEMESSKKL